MCQVGKIVLKIHFKVQVLQDSRMLMPGNLITHIKYLCDTIFALLLIVVFKDVSFWPLLRL